MGRASDRRKILRIDTHGRRHRPDTLAAEEPLEIQLNGSPFTVTMRTPGDDVDLALGFLHAEGVIADPKDTAGAKHCTDSDLNVLDVTLRVPAPSPARGFTVSSACGVCGSASLDALQAHYAEKLRYDLAADPIRVTPDLLQSLPDRLRAAQRIFDRTGGLHAAALFTSDGELICAREDVGRHNAVDKVIGWALREDRLPLTSHLLAVSGRAGSEIVHKAAMAGIPVLTAVSAPSTLAVDLARGWNLTLAGFVRDGQCNVYSGEQRITD
ncbi:formate dehydrogenase accessory sulfurtransferase FdhD [Stackebrandtia nassauensis]|uniref:Sulfur carrier protein FdhD n=1 Tax=Stackebrandtia nassauensis (strain DSM 44728 / CIP 108903 / NRRL B-16338 / NBRC 102104 / LLR-40K-21) TaxID=446470 RepID=D3Q348_STANL|nr:formate dehydrogenase accessory sulfurtransferase FdhD [Stackebrandtia nassauensis]ADD40018.1 formate dehydrogenase family accessory protein FdhD [Stackebrandtia nassauensis DSM 44728]